MLDVLLLLCYFMCVLYNVAWGYQVGVTVLSLWNNGVNKLPASLLKKMEQNSPGTLKGCTVVPHNVEVTYREGLVFHVW